MLPAWAKVTSPTRAKIFGPIGQAKVTLPPQGDRSNLFDQPSFGR